MVLVGFKSMTVRILDNKNPVEGTNLFTFEGKQDKGATQKVDIKGLSADVVKTYGSNIAYHVSRKGVGDVEADFELLDMRMSILEKLLGYKKSGNLGFIGADTEAPYCSILLESEEPDGTPSYFAFFRGNFSKEELGTETLKDKQEELGSDKLTYTALPGDSGDAQDQYLGYYVGKEESEVTKLKQLLKMVSAG
ncbi:MAG: major tail protein [Streptococcus sp.]|nr:major tail protein [Streptococcus sp.]